MLYLFFPVGNSSGWDICGKYLTLELSKLCEVGLVTASQVTPDKIGNEIEYYAIKEIPINSIDKRHFIRKENRLRGVSIRTLNDFNLSLWLDEIRSEKVIGYTFYIGPRPTTSAIHSAGKFDLIVAGSSFCEQQLKDAGLMNTKTIIQGINPQIFNPINPSKSLFRERFVIFSGGKLEFRKGQDIVLKAFKIFSEKHSDALLINSWSNLWEFSLNTMSASNLIDFRFDISDYSASMKNLYRMNGIDPEKVITLPIKPAFQLAYVLKNTDVGLFPNRCEGGTNLMLMEYMASGKPAIATSKTGHSDIVTDKTSFAIKNYTPVHSRSGPADDYQGWVEPDMDEIIHYLETAYSDTELRTRKGEEAGSFLSGLTWKKAATEFHDTAKEFM
jgi:glycosyltransferase involved in cell wall biosynthesis